MASKKSPKKVELEVLVDKKPNNKSFVKVAKDLKKQGIEDTDFLFLVFNPALLGKDPYSPTLQMEDVRNISNECEANMWYYVRECLMGKKALDDGSMFNFVLTQQSLAAFHCIFSGYSILLDMPKADAMRIAASIMLYFHQCGPRKHFEVLGKTDDDQFELSEFGAYYVTSPMYVTSQMNIEPIYYETEECAFDEFKYSKMGAYLYAEQAFTFNDIERTFTKWKTSAKKPVLILTHDNKVGMSPENQSFYKKVLETDVTEWDPKYLHKMNDIQKIKKKGLIRISK